MTLLQRISRNARNAVLLCPRSLRLNGRRRGLNVVLITLFLFSFTIYITQRKPDRPTFLDDAPKLERELGINVELVPKINAQPVVNAKPVMVTRGIAAVAVDEYDIKKEGAARRLMSVKNCTRYSPEMVGEMKSNPNITPTMEEVIQRAGADIGVGGCYSPIQCRARQKVAIIIPFKDREAHLKTLLYHLHPMLKRQRIHYCIYVAEQYDNGQFNKATIMNAAFEEAVKLDNYDCIIFHDVDMIPENDRNLYMCGKQPRHLSPAIDKFDYKPHYGTDFGGVTAIRVEHYRLANGHSNRFWGWGGEDNDMEYRIRYRNMSIIPSSLKVGRYMMIPHLHPWKFSPNKFPWKLNNTRKVRASTDGLTDLRYRLLETVKHPVYTKLIIDIRRIQVTKLTLYIDGKSAMDIDLYPETIDVGQCRWEQYPNTTLEKNDRIDDSANVYSELDLAKTACEDMKALCGGVVAEYGGNFTLRKKGPPKHSDQELTRLLLGNKDVRLYGALGNDLRMAWVKLRKAAATGDFTMNREGKRQLRTDTHVVLDPENQLSETGAYKTPTLRETLDMNSTAYVKYCPGFFGAHQKLPMSLKQTISGSLDEWVMKNDGFPFRHFFGFKIDAEVLMQPSEYMYYMDEKHFESHLEKGENHYTFTWPGNKAPNFSDPKTPKKFSFRTPDFAIPNIPGTYAVESRVVDRYRQPYFQWNWWFEVTSGDPYLDAETREKYWKKKMAENMARGRSDQHSSMLKQKKEKEQKTNQAEFERRMREMKKKQAKHPLLPMPPKVSEMIDQVQKHYDKHEGEGDPIESYVDRNDPVFQKNFGVIKVADHDPDIAIPKSKSYAFKATTTTAKLNRLSTIKSKFHLLPPDKKSSHSGKDKKQIPPEMT